MFQLRQEQFAAIRRKKIGDGLIATFADSPARAYWSSQKKYVISSDPLGNQTRFGFDEQGFIAAVASPLGRLWQIANYPDGKAAVLRNPAGHELSLTYTPAGQLSTISGNGNPRLQLHYDDYYKPVATSFPDGTFSAVDYTPWGTPATMTNRLGLRDLCEYDENRRLTALTNGNGSKTEFLYSIWSRPDITVFPNGTSESYAYSKKGFVTEIATEETQIDLQPDDKGRPVALQYSDSDEVKYKYDDQGRTAEASLITAASESEHACRFAWNDAGLLESEQSGDVDILYEYDRVGRLVSMTGPTGEKIEYEWDADSRLTLVRDWNGGEHRIEYAPNDRGNILTAPNGLNTLTLLNNLGRPENIAVSDPKNKAIFSLGYVYDTEDRIASIRDSAFGYRDFRYDPEGQLLATDSQGETPSEAFIYDGAGNPVSINGKTATFDPANQILSLGHSQYDHDRRGNLIRMDTAKGLWRFTWNARNLMTSAESPSGVITTYVYDGFGRRIRKQREGYSVEYQWAGEQMIAEIITTSQTAIRYDYLYYPGTYTPLAVRVEGQVYSYHCDHLGTPRMVSAPDGSTVWLADYASYGAARIAHGTFRNPLRAPGQYFDEETSLHYNRFRYYSTELGRYITRDPLGFFAELNFYRHAQNDPTNNADPYGLWTWAGVGKAALTIGAAVAVGAAVIAFAPVAAPLALVLAGAAAGAVAGGLNEALNEKEFCPACVLKAAGFGALAGTASALPFLLLPAGAGLAAVMGAGGLSGAVGYATNYLDGSNPKWNWGDFGKSVALGAGSAGLAKGVSMLAGPAAPVQVEPPPRLPQDINVNPTAPEPLPLNRPVGMNSNQNAMVQTDIEAAQAQGGTDFRVNQQQVNADGVRVGTNRPDLQYTDANGQRTYIEYDTSSSDRGLGHQQRILANDPDGNVILKTVD
jgi:RHS repeat-associated protein